MPVVTVRLVAGRTHDQKQELAKRITEDVVEILKTTPEHVWVTFDEVPGQDWFIESKPLRPPQ